ncbi:hypothetical protein HD806DRAFT_11250 [Xylariaceae sp. AK1471]|nr:hypothetical protein HD806DRAFT_11250 [Xylariaceae sp. AK1471]
MASDPPWFTVEQDSQPPAEASHQERAPTDELPSSIFSTYCSQTGDPFPGISFDMPPMYLNNLDNMAEDDYPPINYQDNGMDTVTITGCETRTASNSHTECTTSFFVASPTATEEGCELSTRSEPLNHEKNLIVSPHRSQNLATEELLPASMPLHIPSTAAPISSQASLDRTTLARTQWHPIMPKPSSGVKVYQEASPLLSKRKCAASPLEHFTRVNECWVGVFNSMPGGLHQSTPKQKKQKMPKACLRCQLDRKKCSGERPCQRCFQILEKVQSNKTIYWKYCVDTDILEDNPILNGLHNIAKYWDYGMAQDPPEARAQVLSRGHITRTTSAILATLYICGKFVSRWGLALTRKRHELASGYANVSLEGLIEYHLIREYDEYSKVGGSLETPVLLCCSEAYDAFNGAKELLKGAKTRSAGNNSQLLRNLTIIFLLSKTPDISICLSTIQTSITKTDKTITFDLNKGGSSGQGRTYCALQHLASFARQWIKKLSNHDVDRPSATLSPWWSMLYRTA